MSAAETRDVTVRRVAGDATDRLVPLCLEHAAFERIPHALANRMDALAAALDAAPPRLHAWLAEHAGEAVGYATASLDFSTLAAAPYVHMDCLYVCEGWRGRAIGQLLWRSVRGFALASGCTAMQWQTPEWNEGAARFYLRLGAHESRKRRYALALDGAARGT